MKTCLTCGALVADNADVCPDCGMELDASTPPSATSSAAPTPPYSSSPAAGENAGGGSGFTVDFGFDAAPATPATPAPVDFTASDPNPFDFDEMSGAGAGSVGAGSTVAIDPIAPPRTPPPAPVAPLNTAQIALKRAGSLTGDAFTFGPGSIVGRFDPDSGPVDVDLAPLPEASYVSRHHAEFRYDAGSGAWFIRDMGSSNGTFYRAGGQGAFARLSGEQAVQNGDEIALGNARFEFKTP